MQETYSEQEVRFGASELSRNVPVSRATIYRYIDLGLLEPGVDQAEQHYFTAQHIQILAVIHRLNRDFRYKVNEIKDLVWSRFDWDEIAAMETQNNDELYDLLKEKGVLWR